MIKSFHKNMAKIVILIGRAFSGKTKTIKSLAEMLGLRRERFDDIGYILCGQAQEIYTQTGSIQEEVISKFRDVFAQLSSLQEKNKAILEKVIDETKKWIKFLSDKPNAIAIIPFTLLGKEFMEELIIRPLELFNHSGNDVKVVYLYREYKINIKYKKMVENVMNKIGQYHTITSEKEYNVQAQELLDYLELKPSKKIEVVPLGQFI